MKKVLCKRTTYLHENKEANWCDYEDMIEEGLMDGWSQEKMDKFIANYTYSNSEVELELEVYEDGSSRIIAVDGKEVLYKPKQLILFK